MTEDIHLKWYHTFVFLFQTVLSISDITTDAWTCSTYLEDQKYARFAIGLTLIVVPMAVTCVWSIVASTSRTLSNDDQDQDGQGFGEVDFFFRTTLLNICLSCFCCGPTLHSFELFLFCARNFHVLWLTKDGIKVKKDEGRLYHLYMHNINMKLVEGLLESGPQLILQTYVMVKQIQDGEEPKPTQIVSASISFLCLTWTITSSDVLREYSACKTSVWQTIAIFISNVGLTAARAGAIIFFCVVLRWWLALVVFVHWLIFVLMGFVLWNSKRLQDIVYFVFAHSPSYIFVFRLSLLKNIRGSKPMSRATEYFATALWYFFFAAENVTMILVYLDLAKAKSAGIPRYCTITVVTTVVVGTCAGITIKCLLWFFCFKDCPTELETRERSRPVTILVRDGGVVIRSSLSSDSQLN